MTQARNQRQSAATSLRRSRDQEARELFQAYLRTRDIEVRNRIVLLHRRLAGYFAQRFSALSGYTHDDLEQVALIGLISAVERYDPQIGGNFATFAGPTIVGVIKRYLRDHTWALKVPRRLREFGVSLRRVRERLEARLGRAPTVLELAAEVGCSEERILEAMELEFVYQPVSLDSTAPGDESGTFASSWYSLGALDPGIEAVDRRESVREAIAQLEEREQHIIYQRFFREASQTAVGASLQISQMHVSRLERRALARLREALETGWPVDAEAVAAAETASTDRGGPASKHQCGGAAKRS